MPNPPNRISDDAVKKATGRTWREWFLLLDTLGARDKSYPQIAQMLQDGGHLNSGWWAKMVTNRYETAHGLRVVGQSASAGFEIGARRTFPVSAARTWSLLLSPQGLRIWLGGILTLDVTKGARFRTEDGTNGEVRTPPGPGGASA